MLLDHEGKDLTNVMSSIVNELVNVGYINDETGGEILRVLLYRHKYVDSKIPYWKSRNQSIISISVRTYILARKTYLISIDCNLFQDDDLETSPFLQKFSKQFSRHDSESGQYPKFSRQFSRHNSEQGFPHKFSKQSSRQDSCTSYQIKSVLSEKSFRNKGIPEVVFEDVEESKSTKGENNHHTSDGFASIDMPNDHGLMTPVPSFGGDLYKLSEYAKKHSIMMRVPEDTEGALTLVGALEFIEEPLTAFVRLEEGIIMPNALEIPLPMRFLFLLLTPKNSGFIDAHEVGRSFSTLMSNRRFHNVCYRIECRKELLNAINDFLDESVVLPPGDWEGKNLLSMNEIHDLRNRKKRRKKESEDETKKSQEKAESIPETFRTNPLLRAPYMFGGLINDIKQRSRWYLSDIKDGFNSQVLAGLFISTFLTDKKSKLNNHA